MVDLGVVVLELEPSRTSLAGELLAEPSSAFHHRASNRLDEETDMAEKFDPVIEAALIQAAATLAVEASAFSERNQRAFSNFAGPHGAPIIDQTENRAQPLQILISEFGNALVEVRETYKEHLKHPRISSFPKPE